jgi:hypothetical protein
MVSRSSSGTDLGVDMIDVIHVNMWIGDRSEVFQATGRSLLVFVHPDYNSFAAVNQVLRQKKWS